MKLVLFQSTFKLNNVLMKGLCLNLRNDIFYVSFDVYVLATLFNFCEPQVAHHCYAAAKN